MNSLRLPIVLLLCLFKNPVKTSSTSFETSSSATRYLVNCIKGLDSFESETHNDIVYHAKELYQSVIQESNDHLFADVLVHFSQSRQRAIRRTCDCISSWLTVLPLSKEHFNLSTFEFRDGLSLRYGKPLLHLLPNCDGCGAPFTVNHALDCKRGGLIVQRHNEIRDTLFDLSMLGWKQVIKEPIIRDSTDSLSGEILKTDIAIRGVW